jgi:spore germination protein GerM
MSRRGAVLASLALVLAGCGYEGSSDVRRLPSDELFGLDQTTTTSTTTTTTTTTTTAPPPPAASVETTTATAVTIAMTTTTTALATETVRLFFLDDEQLTSVTQNISSPARVRRVLEALEAGPIAGPATVGLTTAVPQGIVNTALARSGVAEVDLVGEVYDLVPPDEQLPAVAQIVLTLTQRPGIGQVSFTLDGEPLRVRLGNGQTTDVAGQPVSADDYAILLDDDGSITPPTTTVSASTPPTTLRPPPRGAN